MKLSTKTILYYMLFSMPLFLLGGWLLQRGIAHSIEHEVEEELLQSKSLWTAYLQQLPDAADLTRLHIPQLFITASETGETGDRFADTVIYQPVDGHDVPYRMLTTHFHKSGKSYRLTHLYTLVEKEDVIKNIIRQMALIFIGIFLVFLLINYVINKTVWKPFYTSLNKLAHIDIRKLNNVQFEKTTIKEFSALNETLNVMTRKIFNDYSSMKNFTENASHEIQTPLAIAQSKLELLLQDESLTGSQTAAINAASEACQRLSKLNQSLLLFTRIENNQFNAAREINAREVMEKYISFFEEQTERKQISINTNIADCYLPVHPMLLDILLSNLLSNAIRYNTQSGILQIEMNENGFSIKNTSDLTAIEETVLFHRFAKHDHATGTGLGLAIVKEICDNNKLKIKYSYQLGWHQFDVFK